MSITMLQRDYKNIVALQSFALSNASDYNLIKGIYFVKDRTLKGYFEEVFGHLFKIKRDVGNINGKPQRIFLNSDRPKSMKPNRTLILIEKYILEQI